MQLLLPQGQLPSFSKDSMRFACIVSWGLADCLLPSAHGVCSGTGGPRLRESGFVSGVLRLVLEILFSPDSHANQSSTWRLSSLPRSFLQSHVYTSRSCQASFPSVCAVLSTSTVGPRQWRRWMLLPQLICRLCNLWVGAAGVRCKSSGAVGHELQSIGDLQKQLKGFQLGQC